jgi:hypothetical protein
VRGKERAVEKEGKIAMGVDGQGLVLSIMAAPSLKRDRHVRLRRPP